MAHAARKLARRFGRWATGNEALLTAVIFGVLIALKLAVNAEPVRFSYDGGLYANVARHFRDGDGLVTDISLFHKAFTWFPHPVCIYPVWPVVLGLTARVLPLSFLAAWLPTVFFFGTLALAYRWALLVAPRDRFPLPVEGLNAGHVLLVILGFHEQLFLFTSRPYTEGLAFFLLFAGLILTHHAAVRPSFLRGLALGLVMSLAVLTRTQFVVVVLAQFVALVFAVVVVREQRRRYVALGLAAAAAFFPLLVSHFLWSSTFSHELTVGQYLRFECRESDLLAQLPMFVEASSPWEWLLDRLRGFGIAFHPSSRFSYARAFFGAAYLLPLAILVGGIELLLRRQELFQRATLQAAWRRLREPGGVALVVVACVTAATFLSIHTVHKAVFREWNFHTRHAVLCGLAFWLSALYLLRRHALTRILAVILLGSVCFNGVTDAVRARQFKPENITELAMWVGRARQARGPLVVAMPEPQELAYFVRRVGFHDLSHGGKGTPDEDLQLMVEHLGVQLVILPKDRDWRTRASTPWFREHFTTVQRLRGYTVYAPRPPGSQLVDAPGSDTIPPERGSPSPPSTATPGATPGPGEAEVAGDETAPPRTDPGPDPFADGRGSPEPVPMPEESAER